MEDTEPIIGGSFPIDRTNYKDNFSVKLYKSGLLFYPSVSTHHSKNGLTSKLPKISKGAFKSKKNRSSSNSPHDSSVINSSQSSLGASNSETRLNRNNSNSESLSVSSHSVKSSISSSSSVSNIPSIETSKEGKAKQVETSDIRSRPSIETSKGKPNRPTSLPVDASASNKNHKSSKSSSRTHSRENSRSLSAASSPAHVELSPRPHTNPCSTKDGEEFQSQLKFLPIICILGCDCQRGQTEGDVAAYFVIYAYPRSKPIKEVKSDGECLSHGEIGKLLPCRKRETLTVKFDSLPTFEDNYREAARWMVALRSILRGRDCSNISEIMTGRDILQMPAAPRLLILVNPFSGPGQALTIFQQRVVPLLAQAHLDYKLVVTERAGHAEEFVREVDLSSWSGIVIVSGDGLLFEVVNGLMKRPDWKKAIKTPLGVVPGGSGNALACALCSYASEPYMEKHSLHASFIIAKQRDFLPMDLVAVDTSDGKRLYSFLSVGWGMMADVDIESERYRTLGNSRFALVAVYKIVGLKKYRGRVSFLPVDNYKIPTHGKFGTYHVQKNTNQEQDGEADEERDELSPYLPALGKPVPDGWIVNEDDFILMAGVYQSHLAKDNLMTPAARLDDGVIHLVFVRGVCSRMQMISLFMSLENGIDPQAHTGYAEVVKVKAFRLEPLTPKGMMTVDGEVVEYGPIQAQVLPGLARVMSLDKSTANEL